MRLEAILLARTGRVNSSKLTEDLFSPNRSIPFAVNEVLPTPNDESELAIGGVLDGIETFSRAKDGIGELAEIRQDGCVGPGAVESPQKVRGLSLHV